jgi:hypothetical protein
MSSYKRTSGNLLDSHEVSNLEEEGERWGRVGVSRKELFAHVLAVAVADLPRRAAASAPRGGPALRRTSHHHHPEDHHDV